MSVAFAMEAESLKVLATVMATLQTAQVYVVDHQLLMTAAFVMVETLIRTAPEYVAVMHLQIVLEAVLLVDISHG
jgi:hypothetical protein